MNHNPFGRLHRALGMVLTVMVIGTIGYMLFGMSFNDAAYQTVTTVTTVGFRELQEFDAARQWFTVALIITGASTVLFTFTIAMQFVYDGQLRHVLGRRSMHREIAKLSGHTIVCGGERVGRAVADDLFGAGHAVVVFDIDAARVADVPYPTVVGDATLDSTLREAGVERAGALIAVGADEDLARLDGIAK